MKYKQPKAIKNKQIQKQFWRVFLIEGGLFLVTSLLALIGAFKLNQLVKIKKIYLPSTTLQDFLLFFLFIVCFILLFVFLKNKKFSKFKELIYKGLFVTTCFWGGMTILNLFLPIFGSILVMGVLIALWLEQKKIWVHDILIILGLAGAASFLGLSMSASIIIALLLIFSVYDFIAVYKTKHMVLMFEDMIEKKVILGFIIPKELKYLKDNFNKVKPGGDFMILGGGDVVFPNLLAVSLVPMGFFKAIIVVVFALCGVFFTYYLFSKQKNEPSQKKTEPIPALPPIALFTIAGYLITLFF